MTSSDGINVRTNSKYGNGQHRGRKICSTNMNDIYEFSDNEYNRDSAIYIYTNSTYSDRIRDECKYINRGDNIRNRELWK